MARAYSFAPSEYYHIYSRGVDKKDVFNSDEDCGRFMKLLFFCNGDKTLKIDRIPRNSTFSDHLDKRGNTLVDIGAYCLMSNHFHILVREKDGKGISTFMHRLMTSYSKYFNVKNNRKGHLFESSFQSRHVDGDEYLKYLFAYIHLNPLKIIEPDWRELGIKNYSYAQTYISSYPYSSFMDYAGRRRDYGHVLNKDSFPEYFKNNQEFIKSMFEWLNSDQINQISI